MFRLHVCQIERDVLGLSEEWAMGNGHRQFQLPRHWKFPTNRIITYICVDVFLFLSSSLLSRRAHAVDFCFSFSFLFISLLSVLEMKMCSACRHWLFWNRRKAKTENNYTIETRNKYHPDRLQHVWIVWYELVARAQITSSQSKTIKMSTSSRNGR